MSTALMGYCDSSHLTCPDTGRSRAAFVLMSAGAAVSWKSQLLAHATLSSCESEYLALSMATQEVSYMRQLQFELMGGTVVPGAVRMLVDSQPVRITSKCS